MPNRRSGLFVTFEGIDGTGKTTAMRAATKCLEAASVEVVSLRLPGSSDVGDGVRRLLFFNPTTKAMAPGVADLLFLADHVQATAKIIVPALNAHKTVLCDRYADSQHAYASHPSKGTPSWAFDLYDTLTVVEPDLTFLLTCDPAVAWARSKARTGAEGAKQDGKAWEGPEAQALIQGAYLVRLRHLPRTRLIDSDLLDASQVADIVSTEIRRELHAKT